MAAVRPLRREDSQAATRTALLDAAEALILESSMPGLSLRAVCTRAGYTQGAFYSNFASREDLLLAVMERNLEERVRTFGEMTLDYRAMTFDQTMARIGEWLATVSDSREWAQMAIELRLEAVRNPALAHAIAVAEQRIDVLVSELELPDRSGFELVETLRASTRYGQLPVIGLTVRHDARQIAQAHRLQMSELVAKFDRRGLLAALGELHNVNEEAA